MESILGFLSFLLIEVPARVMAAYPDSPAVLIAIAVVVILLLVFVGRRRRRRKRR
jgi:hypothetical protein